MSDAIEQLATEAERAAARKIVEILRPLSPEERKALIERYLTRHDGQSS